MRIRTKDAAEMLGISKRTVQAMVGRGLLPGAAKIGGILTFDSSKLRRYLDGEEARCRTSISTSEAKSFGCAVPPTESSIELAYAHAISKLRGVCETSASPRSQQQRIMERYVTHGKRR